MQRMGMQLEKAITPAVYYLRFNMDDPVVGSAGGAKSRALRQAMSLAIDAVEYMRLFTNGRGVAAQSPLPPGIFGYELEYRNPYRKMNLARARELLRDAGYPRGIDRETGKPLRLTLDVNDTSARGMLQFQFFVQSWKRLGLQVELQATNYNQFQDKVRRGAYQIFWWGWVADYPDPENFLFLLYGPMSRSRGNGPNTANFDDPRYNALFLRMKTRANDAERLAHVREMKSILESERPWIELFHVEDYALYHGWLRPMKPPGLPFSTAKYYDLDPTMRARQREQWNRPVLWPAYLLAFFVIGLSIAAVVRVRRER
jgi:ABC-type transport system substrate-binding protein